VRVLDCPHCQRRLPETPGRYCPHCGAELPSVPPEPALGPAGTAEGRGIPWDRRAQLGFGPALFETVRQSLFEPLEFFKSMAPTGGIGGPLVYGLLVGYLAQVVTSFYQLVLHGVLGSAWAGPSELPDSLRRLAMQLEGVAGFVVTLLFGWVFVLIGLFVWTAVVHLALLLMGGARRDFEATFRVVSYSQAPQLFAILPICGGLIGAVYALVLTILGLSEAHGIGRGLAAAAVLLPLLLCCCCMLAGVGLVVGGIAGLLGLAR